MPPNHETTSRDEDNWPDVLLLEMNGQSFNQSTALVLMPSNFVAPASASLSLSG